MKGMQLRTKPRNKVWLWVSLLLYLLCLIIIIYLPPASPMIIAGMLMLLFVASFYLFNFIFGARKRALILALVVTFYLCLRWLNLRSVIYLILIISITLVLDRLLRK